MISQTLKTKKSKKAKKVLKKINLDLKVINNPGKFLDPLKFVKIFKDFYLSFYQNNTDYNFDNFPIFMNNAVKVTSIDN